MISLNIDIAEFIKKLTKEATALHVYRKHINPAMKKHLPSSKRKISLHSIVKNSLSYFCDLTKVLITYLFSANECLSFFFKPLPLLIALQKKSYQVLRSQLKRPIFSDLHTLTPQMNKSSEFSSPSIQVNDVEQSSSSSFDENNKNSDVDSYLIINKKPYNKKELEDLIQSLKSIICSEKLTKSIFYFYLKSSASSPLICFTLKEYPDLVFKAIYPQNSSLNSFKTANRLQQNHLFIKKIISNQQAENIFWLPEAYLFNKKDTNYLPFFVEERLPLHHTSYTQRYTFYDVWREHESSHIHLLIALARFLTTSKMIYRGLENFPLINSNGKFLVGICGTKENNQLSWPLAGQKEAASLINELWSENAITQIIQALVCDENRAQGYDSAAFLAHKLQMISATRLELLAYLNEIHQKYLEAIKI